MTTHVCRVCLNQGALTNIFKKCGTSMISTQIMSLAKVQITPDDSLPNTICTLCIKKLEDCIEFIKMCEDTDIKLRALLIKQCEDETLITEDEKSFIEDDKFTFEYDNTLSPKSETEKVLLIDESVDHSIQTGPSSDFIEISTELSTQVEKKSSNLNSKKSQKQQCFTCGKVMSSRFRLKTHLRTHTGERPFSCPHCNKHFSLAQNLKVHLRTHTGEKPLQCSVCGESFAQSAGLAAHRRKHTGQMPYQCVLCPRAFRTVGHLQYHTRRHTGEKNFECDTCGRAFITRSDLKQHLMTHTGDRPHVCCVCGLRLTRASHLKRHIQLTHTGKALSCDTCPAKFTKKTDLDRHMKKHEEAKENTEKN